jgi:hypothetical protein
MRLCLGAEAVTGWMGLDLGLRQPHHLARRQLEPMQSKPRGSTRWSRQRS